MLKRRFDGKTIGAVFIMVMTMCLSAFAGLKSDDVWTLTPSDFRHDMTLYFTLDSKNFTNPDAYEVGAFVEDKCRGVAEKIELPEGGVCLYMRIRSNSPEQDAVSFFVRDRVSGETVVLKNPAAEEFLFRPDAMVGLPSEPYVLVPYYNVAVSAEGNGSVEFKDGSYAEGTLLKLEAVPAVGYKFDEWNDGSKEALLELTVSGNTDLTAKFSINSYKLTFKVGDKIIEEKEVEFGAPVVAPENPVIEGYIFESWGEMPETMPAHDVVVSGTASKDPSSSLEALGFSSDETVTVITLDGRILHKNVKYSDIRIPAGVYIINGRKTIVK